MCSFTRKFSCTFHFLRSDALYFFYCLPSSASFAAVWQDCLDGGYFLLLFHWNNYSKNICCQHECTRQRTMHLLLHVSMKLKWQSEGKKRKERGSLFRSGILFQGQISSITLGIKTGTRWKPANAWIDCSACDVVFRSF